MQRVLLADDSLAARRSIQQVLEAAGFEVVAVGSGDLALSRVAELVPDVVLVDIAMPGLSGYEVCGAIKATPDHAHVPVILLTSDFEPYDAEEAARVGADGHLVKPFDSQAVTLVREVAARSERLSALPLPPIVEEPPSLLPVPEFNARPVATEVDGSSTAGIDAYSTVTIPAIPFEAPALPPQSGGQGTMVVGPVAFGAGPWDVAQPGAARFDVPPGSRSPDSHDGPTDSDKVRRGAAPLPDIAIDALERGAAETVYSAPTTESLDTGLAEDVDRGRSASEAGIRTLPHARLRVVAGICPVCRAPLESGDIFCLTCGAAVLTADPATDPSAPACDECGTPVLPGDVFCVACGAAV